MRLGWMLVVVAGSLVGQTAFEYAADELLLPEVVSESERDRVRILDMTYRGRDGERVPAYLVLPPIDGKLPAIVWGHWAMKGSPLRNRGEFLEEAIVMARAGTISLLPDAPFNRSGHVEDNSPEAGAAVQARQVADVRRGVDYLLSRDDVDGERLAYVGHSFGAGVGAILSGVEPRLKWFVLMTHLLHTRDYLLSDAPGAVAAREHLGDDFERLLDELDWADPGNYVARTRAEGALVQLGDGDELIPLEHAFVGYAKIASPKNLAVYPGAGHALDGRARRDRVRWLVDALGISEPDWAALERIETLR